MDTLNIKQTRQGKVYTKLSKFVEECSVYKNSRYELRELMKKMKELPDGGIETVTKQIDQAILDESGSAVKKVVTKQTKQFASVESKELHELIKQKRGQVLRLSKKSSLFLIRVVQQMVADFIQSCDVDDNSGKAVEKAMGWRHFNPAKFESTNTGSLVRGCPSYCTLLDVKKTLRTLQYEKDLARKQNQNLSKGSIMQDLQKYKQIIKEMSRESQKRSDEFLRMEIAYGQFQTKYTVIKKEYEAEKQIIMDQINTLDQIIDAEKIQQLKLKLKDLNKQFKEQKKDETKQQRQQLQVQLLRKSQMQLIEQNNSEFTIEQLKTMTNIHDSIQFLQAENNESKKFLNDVKQTLKTVLKKQQVQKATNGFKCFVSRVVYEFLIGLTKRIEVYVGNDKIKNIKDNDLLKIFKIWSNGENQPEIFECLSDLSHNQPETA